MLVLLTAIAGAVVGLLTPRVVHRFSAGPAVVAFRHPHRPRPGSGLVPGAVVASRHGIRRWLTAAIGLASFGLLALVLAGDPALPAFLAVAACGVPLAAVDVACLRLPDPLVATAGLAGMIGLTGAAITLDTPAPLLRALTAALCCAAGYVVLALLPGSRLGFGDVKLAGVLGLPLGWLGWPAVVLGLALSHLINGLVALVLLLSGRAARDSALPFGPAMLLGALLAVPLAG